MYKCIGRLNKMEKYAPRRHVKYIFSWKRCHTTPLASLFQTRGHSQTTLTKMCLDLPQVDICEGILLLYKGKSAYRWHRGCLIIIWTGLNIKIGIVQRVYEWPNCPFAKMIPWLKNHYGKIPAWSLIYFLNYDQSK